MAICPGLPYVELGSNTYSSFSASGRRGKSLGGLNAQVTLNIQPGDVVPPAHLSYAAIFDGEGHKISAGVAAYFAYPFRAGGQQVTFRIIDFAWFLQAKWIEDYSATSNLADHVNNMAALAGVRTPGADFNAMGLFSGGTADTFEFSASGVSYMDALLKVAAAAGGALITNLGGWANLAELVVMSVSGGSVFGLNFLSFDPAPEPNAPFPHIVLPLSDCDYMTKIQDAELSLDWSNVITRVTVLGKNGQRRIGPLINNYERITKFDIPAKSEARHFKLEDMVSVVQEVAMYQQAKIIDFTPKTGTVGTTITVEGVYFTNTTDVAVNGTSASSFTVVDDKHLTFAIPTGATTGSIVVTTSDSFLADSITELTVT